MLWKLHKVLNETSLIESLFNKDAGLQMSWKLFLMLLHFQMCNIFLLLLFKSYRAYIYALNVSVDINTCLWIYTLWIYSSINLENTDENKIFFACSPQDIIYVYIYICIYIYIYILYIYIIYMYIIYIYIYR